MPRAAVFVSTISFWEISLKFALGKLHLEDCAPDDLPDSALEMGLVLSPLTVREAAGFHKLPRLKHKDPFDRILIRQAIVQDLPLVSADRAFADYEVHGLTLVY